MLTGLSMREGAYDNGVNEVMVNTHGVELVRSYNSYFHKRTASAGAYDNSILKHEAIHAFVADKNIDVSQYKPSKLVKNFEYAKDEQGNETFTRELQKRIEAKPDTPIYYNEQKGVFTEGRFYDRVRDRLGIIH